MWGAVFFFFLVWCGFVWTNCCYRENVLFKCWVVLGTGEKAGGYVERNGDERRIEEE